MGKAARSKKEKSAYKNMLNNGVRPNLAAGLISGKLQILDDNLNPIPLEGGVDEIIKRVKEVRQDTSKLKQAIASATLRLDNSGF